MLVAVKSINVKIKKIANDVAVGKFAVAVVDQALISGGSFMIGVYMARNFSKSEYAYYVIAITISQVLVNFQNALINTPLLVRRSEAGPGYESGSERLNYIFACGLISCVTPGVFYGGTPVLAAALFFGVFLIKEFRKNILYADLKMFSLLRIDFMYLLFMGVALALMVAVKVWWIIFIFMLIGHAISLFFSDSVSSGCPVFKRQTVKEVLVGNWNIVQWAIVGVTATVLESRSYVYITTSILGPDILADLSVTRMILMPLALSVGSSSKIIIVWGKRALDVGDEKLFRLGIGVLMLVLTVFAVSYISFVFISYPYINDMIFNGKYYGLRKYVVLWGIYFLMYTYLLVLSNSMQALKKFKQLAFVGIITGLFIPVLAGMLSSMLGGSGAILALIVGVFIQLGYLARLFWIAGTS